MELLEGIYLKEELLNEENMGKKHRDNLSQKIDFKPKIEVTVKTGSSASSTAIAEAVNTVTIEIQNILGKTEMLKEDIERELKIKKVPAEEIELAKSDVEVFENALKEADSAKNNNQEVPKKSKNCLTRFWEDIKDEKSSIHKALKMLRKGKDYGVSLAETYNKIAENIGMPLVPTLALGIIKKL